MQRIFAYMEYNEKNIESAFFEPHDENVMMSDDYSDFSELSSGGFCRLVKARRNGRWWTLKCLKPEYADIAFYQNMLKKEYAVLSLMNHPGIVMVFTLEQIGEYGLCIVMEYIEGRQLSAEYFTREERCRLMTQLMNAMEYVHSLQIVHRDLKPQNILIANNGHNVKLIDFGLADTDSHSELKQPAGTVSYVSPEQLASNHPDVRNDIYSLGCIMKEMNLGWQYHNVLKRMMAPIDRRYANMTAVKQSMRRAGRLPRLLAGITIITVVLLSAFAAGWYMNDEQKIAVGGLSTNIEKLKTHSDSLQQILNEEKAERQKLEEKLRESNKTQVFLQEKADKDEAQKRLFAKAVEDGKRFVVRRIKEKRILTYKEDTYEHQLKRSQLMSEVQDELDEYVKSYKGIDPTLRTSVKKEIVNFYVEKCKEILYRE